AQPAADALLGVHVDDAVRVLDDGTRSGARSEAARVGAVHALVLPEQPREVPVHLRLVEADQVPELSVERGECLVAPDLLSGDRWQVVPLLARDLAGLAADAGRGVDVLAEGRGLPERAVLPAERGRGPEDLETLDGHDRSSGRRERCDLLD